MLRWNNDYCYGAHPLVLKAIVDANDTAYPGYAKDDVCMKASEKIKEAFKCKNADVHYFSGGTQANFVMINAAIKSYQNVICHKGSHINIHESGAIENAGRRIHAYDGADGKITADIIRKEGKFYKETGIPEFYTEPKLVYLSFPNEIGAMYTKAELTDIRKACDEYGIYLFIDGARLGYAMGSPNNDVTREDIAKFADCFYVGGTKCGSLYGEAMVITNDNLKNHFRNYMKQNGAILSKGFLLGIQFDTLFTDDLYFEICKKATLQALRIKDAFIKKGLKMYSESFTNQQFVIFDTKQLEIMNKKHITDFEAKVDDNHTAVRFCTSWQTKDSDVDVLIKDIENL